MDIAICAYSLYSHKDSNFADKCDRSAPKSAPDYAIACLFDGLKGGVFKKPMKYRH